jgi:four helix bundle protein
VGVRHFTDLVAWRLAAQLRDQIVALTNEPAVARDFRFCSQIRDAASSAPSNIAEGFCRYSHREFAQFLKVAYGSLGEVQNHLTDARERGYVDDHAVAPVSPGKARHLGSPEVRAILRRTNPADFAATTTHLIAPDAPDRTRSHPTAPDRTYRT